MTQKKTKQVNSFFKIFKPKDDIFKLFQLTRKNVFFSDPDEKLDETIKKMEAKLAVSK